MRVGFFGGTFDPPHRGHLAVARAAAAAFGLKKVLLAPVASQPLKPDDAEASYVDRLRMVQLICGDGLEASEADAPRPDGTPNYTIDTLRRLRSALPEDAELFVVVGADAFRTFRRWKDPDGLLREAQWIVVSRPGTPLRWDDLNLSAAQSSRIHPLEGVAEPASASTVRERLHAGEDCTDLLPSAVLAYIRKHHLYGT